MMDANLATPIEILTRLLPNALLSVERISKFVYVSFFLFLSGSMWEA